MKKYLWLLAPVVFCGAVAMVVFVVQPREQPNGMVIDNSYVATAWLWIGFAVTALFAAVFVINDTFDALERWFERRARRRGPE